ncbi:MAG: transketolase C-terminal domain-containing protein, partial [Atribacterota bacterium]
DKDMVPPMADFGSGYRYHVTGLVHNEKGYPTSDAEEIDKFLRRLSNKVELNKKDIVIKEEYSLDDAKIAIVAYGSVARAAQRTMKLAREKGIKVGLLKLITLWPFDDDLINKLASQVDMIVVPEMNLGQMVREVQRAAQGKSRVTSYTRIDGDLINPIEILEKIEEEISK